VVWPWLLTGAWLQLAMPTLAANQCKEIKNKLEHNYESCGECLQKTGGGCGWCPSVEGDHVVGCVPVSLNSTCKGTFEAGNTQSKKLPDRGANKNISPEKYSVEARPKITVDVKFTAKKEAVPVDIYFLVDQSNSMAGERDTLAKLSKSIGAKIKELTPRGFRLGFGAFFEKPIPPFSQRLTNRNYDFIHYLSMTDNLVQFENSVKTSELKGNHDTPEAGLDALMQVIRCKEIIGWKDDITHIIILLTDAPYHFAGDGILAGLWKPYDTSKCKLEKDGRNHVYNSLEHDYPSLSEVNYWLAQEKKNLIFGTADVVTKLYKDLGDNNVITSTAGDMGDGKPGSDQKMLDLITTEYSKIKDSIKIVKTVPNEDLINITVSSNCKIGKPEANSFTCKKINVGQSVEFTAHIELKPEICNSPSKKYEVSVEVFGQPNSKLTIDLTPICDCGCEKSRPQVDQNNRCTKGNALGIKCGACECKDNFSGEFCQCEAGTAGTGEDLSKCNDGNNRVCGDRGKCECGECICDPKYSGRFCQCEVDTCKKDTQDCSGHGSCECEGEKTEAKCDCNNGWGGETCACKENYDGTPDEEVCMDPFSSGNEVCNGVSHGGSCECKPYGRQCACSAVTSINNNYAGEFCQKHPTKSDQEACDKAEHCVLFKVFGKTVDAAQREEWFQKCKDSKLRDVLRCRKIYTSSNKDDNLNNTFTEDIENSIDDNLGDDEQQKQIDIKTKDMDVYENDCEKYSNDLPKIHSPCTTSYGGCTVEYYHDGILDYTYQSRKKKKNFYIRFFEDQNLLDKEKRWTPINCTSFSLAYTVGITVGVLLFIGAVLFFTYAILINLRDKWEYERFLEMQKGAFDGFDEEKPTIYKGTSSVKQRLSRMSLKK